MASIPPTSPSANAQLNGIVNTVPQPRGPAATFGGATPFTLEPHVALTLGGAGTPPFTITAGDATGVAGGGGAPAAGAQPPAPGAAPAATPPAGAAAAPAPAAPTTPAPLIAALGLSPGTPLPDANAAPVTVGTPAAGAAPVGGAAAAGTTPVPGAAAVAAGTDGARPGSKPVSKAVAVSGFGKAQRAKKIKASVNGATFSFPSFKATSKQLAAPKPTWGPGWKRVEKDGLWYMQHANGTKAVPAVEWRVTPQPLEKAQMVKVANGWGKKFPDGSLLIFDKKEGPYTLDPSGAKHAIKPGTHTIGGVKVRIFEATVVRTLETSGAVSVFDSRGNHGAGTPRGRATGALVSAGGGVDQLGNAPGKDASTQAGGAPAKGGGSIDGAPPAKGGGATGSPEAMAARVQELTGVARKLLDQVRSGSLDPAALQSLQAQLSQLPAGILQAAGAAGTMTGDASTILPAGTSSVAGASGAGTTGTTAPGTTAPGTTAPGATVAAVSGAGVGASTPVANRDAQADAVKTLAAGATATVTGGLPAEFTGKQARFGQLPEDVQVKIATAFGSDQGTKALEADTMVAIGSAGAVSLPDGATLFAKHVALIRGAGPGEDLALTMRPTRQPGSTGTFASAAAMGGGASSATGDRPTSAPRPGGSVKKQPKKTATAVAAGGGATHAHGAHAMSSTAATAKRKIQVFAPGSSLKAAGLAGIEGSFTWKTLPAAGRTAISDWLAANPNSGPAKAFASRTGSGWSIDPAAVIVLGAGTASFLQGLAVVRAQAKAAPAVQAVRPVTGGGAPTVAPAPAGSSASAQPVGHDATRPPAAGGPVPSSPGTAPPAPAIADPGEHAVGHAH